MKFLYKYAISFLCVFLQLKYALYVIVTCIIACAIVKYVNQTVQKLGTAKQRVHLLNSFTNSIAYIKIIRRNITQCVTVIS